MFTNPKLETAHVLFMDIVGYAKLPIEGQTERVKELQQIIRGTEEFQGNPDTSSLVCLHTGDGMALSFFGNPEAPVRCATEISQALKVYSELKLRMGLHSGVVQRLADINANMNIAGGGINIAQRVMDCGDAGHILLSKSVAEDLGQLSRWTGKLHDLGEAEVKHGVRVHIFNLYDDEIGNSAVPSKLRLPKTRRRWVVPAAALAVAVLVVAIFGFAILSGPRAQRVLNYSLTVQKMREGKPYGEPYESSGQEIYENGYKFRLNVSSPQSGYLYVFNEGAEENGSLSFTIIYPTPVTKSGSAKINEDEPVQTNWNTFGGQAGTEEFWIIWSASPISQLEAARDAAFKSEEGALTNAATVRSIKEFLTSHSDPKAQLIKDKIKQQTNVRTNGELLVTRLDLEHR